MADRPPIQRFGRGFAELESVARQCTIATRATDPTTTARILLEHLTAGQRRHLAPPFGSDGQRTMLVDILKTPVRWALKFLYRVEVIGVENYHAAGNRVLIVANHVSLLDGLLFYLFFPERPTFAINSEMAKKWYFQPFLWFVDLFLLDPTNPISMKSLIRYLREDRKAVIFPEGRITITGSLMKIYDGPGMVADKAQATILPVGIEGAQYTPFSYLRGAVRIRWLPKITIRFLTPEKLEIAEELQGSDRRKAAAEALTRIMRRIAYQNCNTRTTVFEALLDAMQRHGASLPIIEDIQRKPLSYRRLVTGVFVLGDAIARLLAEVIMWVCCCPM